MTDVTTYQLKHPIEVQTFSKSKPNYELDEVDVRRPLVTDLAQIDTITGTVAKEVKLLSALTGLPEFVIQQFDCEDFAELQKMIAPYIALAQGDAGAVAAS